MGSGFSRLRELDEYFRMDIGVAWLLVEYLDYPKGFASVYTVIGQETSSSMFEHGQPQFHTLPIRRVNQCPLRSDTHASYFDSIDAFNASITPLNAESHIVLYHAPLPAIDKSTGTNLSVAP